MIAASIIDAMSGALLSKVVGIADGGQRRAVEVATRRAAEVAVVRYPDIGAISADIDLIDSTVIDEVVTNATGVPTVGSSGRQRPLAGDRCTRPSRRRN